MNERTMKLRLGAAVVLSIVIIVIFLTFLGSHENLTVSSYEIKIQMADAPNVVENTPIYQSGILIGRVAKVELTDTKGVIISAHIYGKHKLFHDQECHLSSSLLGDASLRIVTRPPSAEGLYEHTPIQPGEVIHGRTSLNPTLLIAEMQEKITVAIDDVTIASQRLTDVASTTNEILEENRQNIRDIMGNARSITENSSKIVGSFSAILDEEFCSNLQISVANLREASEKLPGTLTKVDETLTNMQSTITLSNDIISKLSGKLDSSMGGIDQMIVTLNSTLGNVEKITAQFSDENQMKMWSTNLSNILRNMDAFTETLNQQDSTLGLLLHDRTMYDKMRDTMDRINELPRKLDPIIFNAQVMTEKLAQHPELLGLRGYLKKDAGTSLGIPWPKGIFPSSSARSYTPYASSNSYDSFSSGYSSPYSNSSSAFYQGNMANMTPNSTPTAAQQSAGTYSSQFPAAQTVPAASAPVVQTVPAAGAPAAQTAPVVSTPAAANVPAANVPTAANGLKAPSTSLKAAEMKNSAGASNRTNTQIPADASQITPEMLGMTPEEFRNADVQVISDAVLEASVNAAGSSNATLNATLNATSNVTSNAVSNASANVSETAGTPVLPPAMAPITVNPSTGMKAPEK